MRSAVMEVTEIYRKMSVRYGINCVRDEIDWHIYRMASGCCWCALWSTI